MASKLFDTRQDQVRKAFNLVKVLVESRLPSLLPLAERGETKADILRLADFATPKLVVQAALKAFVSQQQGYLEASYYLSEDGSTLYIDWSKPIRTTVVHKSPVVDPTNWETVSNRLTSQRETFQEDQDTAIYEALGAMLHEVTDGKEANELFVEGEVGFAIGDLKDLDSQLDFDLTEDRFDEYMERHNEGIFCAGLKLERNGKGIIALWPED